MKISAFILIALFAIYGCNSGLKGNLNQNLPPTTGMAAKEINRPDSSRFSSQIEISWWGDDPDGYVIGYEYSINDTTAFPWRFTTKNDSIFILPIPSGERYANVKFMVRAIDNNHAHDPKGASLVYPIKNTPPVVTMNKTEMPPDTLYDISSFGWMATDLDGDANLSHIEVALNDTTKWVSMPTDITFISLKAQTPDQDITDCEVFQGRSYTKTSYVISGLHMNGRNKFYVRAVDNAGAYSKSDTVSWYTKRRKSGILFLNDYSGPYSATNARFHLDALAQAGVTKVDRWNISDGSTAGGQKVTLSTAFPAVIDPTLVKTLALWKHIYWMSDDMNRNITYAEEISRDFFANGGTMFITMPSRNLEDNDPLFNFLPLDGVTPLPQNATDFLISSRASAIPISPFTGPDLGVISTMSSVFPLRPSSGSTTLYSADFLIRTLTGYEDYTGNEIVSVKSKEGNIIFFGLDMSDLNENNNIGQFIKRMCVDELGF